MGIKPLGVLVEEPHLEYSGVLIAFDCTEEATYGIVLSRSTGEFNSVSLDHMRVYPVSKVGDLLDG